jgi:OOP family OmpA-OmpF porin
LRRNPSLRILVEAHTDNAGSITSSLKLSASQAQSIVDYLVSKGIEKSRLSAAGLGGSRPVAPEYPESERMRNRRVDFISLSDQ